MKVSWDYCSQYMEKKCPKPPIYGKNKKNVPNHQPDEMHPGLVLDLIILGTKWDYLPSGKPT